MCDPWNLTWRMAAVWVRILAWQCAPTFAGGTAKRVKSRTAWGCYREDRIGSRSTCSVLPVPINDVSLRMQGEAERKGT